MADEIFSKMFIVKIIVLFLLSNKKKLVYKKQLNYLLTVIHVTTYP